MLVICIKARLSVPFSAKIAVSEHFDLSKKTLIKLNSAFPIFSRIEIVCENLFSNFTLKALQIYVEFKV